ncbi:sensor domain-containing diguanylate cyclase [Gallaecimonas mangrovi]|uniref:sensor domain-containing diguanylate cyclase n=1 Tax=Gallaecimonas mangrovi TaxID=2291597 RepID=UPI000E20C06A|nr:sensor domain-containing diguanylate cyclase [Gallaecimonas mangrovi]
MTPSKLEQELTQLRKENARLKRIANDARQKLDAALDGTGLCLWQLEVPTGKLVIFNRRWGAMLGFEPKELNAHFDVWHDKLHPDDRAEVVAAFESHLAGESPFYQVMHRMLGKDGSVTWVLDRGRVVEWDEQQKPLKVMGTHIDITKEKEYEQKLAALAHQDPLTGLANRSALHQHFDLLKAQGPLCLAFMDLDDFKKVNDTLGHRSGDDLLRALTRRLQAELPAGVILGRLGGDEFVMLLPMAISNPALQTLAQRLIDTLEPAFELDNGEAQVGISIGIESTQPQDSFDDVMVRADLAMYQVKKAGKRGFLFHQ